MATRGTLRVLPLTIFILVQMIASFMIKDCSTSELVELTLEVIVYQKVCVIHVCSTNETLRYDELTIC